MKPCFIGAFDIDGNRLWQVGHGGSQTARPGPAAIFDIDADGVSEVISFFKHPDKDASESSMADVVIKILDGRDGRLEEQAAPAEFTTATGSGPNWVHKRIFIADFRGNETPQDFICKLGTRYIAFDNNINVLWTYESPWSEYSQCPAYIPSVGDIDGDGKDEVNGGYMLLDDDGSVMWEKKLGMNMDSVTIDRWDDGNMRAFCSGFGHVMDDRGNVILRLGQKLVPHGQELRTGNFLPDVPGNEMVIRYKGHSTDMMTVSNSGEITHRFKVNQSPNNTGMEAVNWFGPGKETLLYNGGVLWRANGEKFSDLPHLPAPVGDPRLGWYHCIAGNLCGDDREEVVIYNPWDVFVWIYTPAPFEASMFDGYTAGPRQYNVRLMD